MFESLQKSHSEQQQAQAEFRQRVADSVRRATGNAARYSRKDATQDAKSRTDAGDGLGEAVERYSKTLQRDPTGAGQRISDGSMAEVVESVKRKISGGYTESQRLRMLAVLQSLAHRSDTAFRAMKFLNAMNPKPKPQRQAPARSRYSRETEPPKSKGNSNAKPIRLSAADINQLMEAIMQTDAMQWIMGEMEAEQTANRKAAYSRGRRSQYRAPATCCAPTS